MLNWLSEAACSRSEGRTELCAAQSQLKLEVKTSAQVFPQSVWLWRLDSQAEATSTAVLAEFQATSTAMVSCWLLLMVSDLQQHSLASALPPLAEVV